MVYISCWGFPKENTKKKEGLALKKRKNRVDKVDVQGTYRVARRSGTKKTRMWSSFSLLNLLLLLLHKGNTKVAGGLVKL